MNTVLIFRPFYQEKGHGENKIFIQYLVLNLNLYKYLTMEKGKIDWISIRKNKGENPTVVEKVQVSIENGLEGDHYGKINGKRQVTLIQKEHLDIVASFLNKEEIDPLLTRRNIVVSKLNLLSLVNKKFKIGNDVILQATGPCVPCKQMDENLGENGMKAMIGHGGITARVIQGGIIQVGDEIFLEKKEIIKNDNSRKSFSNYFRTFTRNKNRRNKY